jgi:hypothetical protein
LEELLWLVLAGWCASPSRLPLISASRAALGRPRPLVPSSLLAVPSHWYRHRRYGRILQGVDAVAHPRSVPPPSLLCVYVFHCCARCSRPLVPSDHRKTASSRGGSSVAVWTDWTTQKGMRGMT